MNLFKFSTFKNVSLDKPDQNRLFTATAGYHCTNVLSGYTDLTANNTQRKPVQHEDTR